MSAASLDDNGTQHLNKGNKEIHDERTRILNTVSRKVANQTLTLEETTELYEKFNQTFSAYRSNSPKEVDESWALELLQECEQDESIKVQDAPLLQTRINGIPHQTKANVSDTNLKSHGPANDDILVAKTDDTDKAITLDTQELRFNIDENFSTTPSNKRHDAFATFLITTSILGLGIFLGFSLFL